MQSPVSTVSLRILCSNNLGALLDTTPHNGSWMYRIASLNYNLCTARVVTSRLGNVVCMLEGL